ncbi:YitT family protein [Soehngenia longivitae]|uniref:YitT family protein n=1 Tax=Soehngenia longivitae TaxID=2562294 RepID=A0A4Z0D2C6_9FIRM|nr:YitT family protein [Soehngenia longivitae]TFZ39697.1 YitT family protein [Soehngenia longivitae]
MKFNLKRFVYINIGLLIMTVGLYFFLMPSNLAVGGATGLAMILNYLIPSIPMGIILAALNVILFIVAFVAIGKDFGGYTIYSSFAFSAMIAIFEYIIPMKAPFTDDLFINLIFGILISGVGMGIVFNEDASTGGTDIIAKIINKYTGVAMGKSLLISDFLIVIFASFVYGARLGMYALLGIVINSFVIDKIISGFNVKMNMMIISKELDSINDFILNEIGRGTTIYIAMGGYSKEEKRIINTIVSRDEYVRIRDYIRSVDNKAFISVSHITEVEGEGFTYD